MNNDLDGVLVEQVAYSAADLYAGDPASDVITLANHQGVRFLVLEGAGATGTATITVEECDQADAGGTNTAIAFRYRVKDGTGAWGAWTDATAAGFTTTAGANKAYELDVDGDGRDQPYLRLQFTEVVDSPVVGVALALLHGARYAETPPVGALA
jgi:hypothetical protein